MDVIVRDRRCRPLTGPAQFQLYGRARRAPACVQDVYNVCPDASTCRDELNCQRAGRARRDVAAVVLVEDEVIRVAGGADRDGGNELSRGTVVLHCHDDRIVCNKDALGRED